ncbi:MAG TPA: glycerophosphodiester phosphodiesterase family protein [Novosphingobium sp.]|nr:glycerophosphodiester phosphodiesterase family protein [Novosphingobium sp.]
MGSASISRRRALGGGATLALAASLPAGALADAGRLAAKRPVKPLVLAHRGASALRPEHTLAAYAKAIEDGADFIEPDLVVTKDGVLVARHENNIAETTDVAARPEFAGRRTTKTIDGSAQTGWFTEDFTLAELNTLRARERLGALRPESQSHDGAFRIVSFEEAADFVAAEAAARGRRIGIIPELKHSTYFAGIGLPLEGRFQQVLAGSTFLRHAPVIVQSFEVANLKALRSALAAFGNVQLMQLIDAPQSAPYDTVAAGHPRPYSAMLTEAGLAEIATYADWIAPNSRVLIPLGADGRLGRSSGVAAAARRAGLLIGAWTFRPENRFLAADFRDDAAEEARNPAGSVAEIRRYLAEGLDGFFTDDPALGRTAIGYQAKSADS